MDVLKANNLTKKFGGFIAVDNISFSLKEGEILGFLGPNGAGKTTTIQMLLGVLTPTSGEIKYFGKDLLINREEILEQINFSSAYTNLLWRLSVKENLNYLSYLYDIKDRKERLNKMIDIFRLKKILDLEIHALSAGEKTRVNLAKALLNYPKVLLLDEPTASLDPEAAVYIREFLLAERKKFNLSIVFTSHNMPEVEEVCDRVIFINQGKIISDDTPDKLAKTIDFSHVELNVADGLKRTIEFCKSKKFKFELRGRFIVIDIKEKMIPDLLSGLMAKGVDYREISIEKPTLEDYFLRVAKYKKS